MTFNGRGTSLVKYSLWTCAGVLALGILTLGFPDGAWALLVVVLGSGVALLIFRSYTDDKDFVTKLFLAGLGIRLLFGVFVHVYEQRSFFGGDALQYNANGARILDVWNGLVDAKNMNYQRSIYSGLPGWGMNYLVATIYLVVGKNILAAQSFCAVIGAATAPMVYFCAKKIFANNKVSRTAALLIAFFPSFIIWSSQLLKDGLIIFLLVVVITMVLQLQEKISYPAIAVLVLSLFGIISLRFYIFYMVATAVAGSFLLGLSDKSTSMLRGGALLIVVGLSLTYLGGIRDAGSALERYGDLDRLQNSRLDLRQSAESGYGEDTDVSTTEGAISAIPLGLAYLMLAPFPWQASNLRQAITIPEVILWWAMIPLLISGIWWTVRNRMRSAFPILFFSLMLTLAYSVFQGNVGTAYRQRTQIQVFLFIFIAVGWELWKEKREDRRAERLVKQRKFDERIQAPNW